MSYRATMTAEKTDIDALLLDAIRLHSAGAVGRAEELYRAVLKQQRNHPDALHMLGVIAFQRGDAQAGIRMVERSLAVRPDFADAQNNLAGMYLHTGKTDKAQALAEHAIMNQPDFPAAYRTRATAQLRQRDFEGAAESFARMSAIDPENTSYFNEWAVALLNLGRYPEAEAMFARVLEINPGNADARCYMAQAIKRQGRFDEALAHLNDLLASVPAYVPALVHAGDALQALDDIDAAIARFREAIRIQPNHAEAHFNLGVSLLTLGRYDEGWAEYSWRFRMEAYAAFKPPADAPMWNGEPLDGKSILIFAEQGLGDTIQFARYAGLLKAQGATVHAQCAAGITELIGSIEGITDMYTFAQAAPEVDYQISMMELPRVFKTDAGSVPSPGGYLRSRRDNIRIDERPAVGLVWQGNTEHTNDAYRSVPLALFERIATRDDIQCYSLQVGDAAGQIATLGWQEKIHDLSPQLKSFSDTADAVSKLDLVISVDTSVAHLAGALGVPVWVLLAHLSDWRWGRSSNDSCWYSSMRLFRQNRLGEWQDVFNRLEQTLDSRIWDITR